MSEERINCVKIIAEIGINHNGDLNIAKKLIDIAATAGCDAVKFQKRSPDVCVPEDQKGKLRQTPWGEMTYLAYKHRMEFEGTDYADIDRHCKSRGIDWSVSIWDRPSAIFTKGIGKDWVKIPSAKLTDIDLLLYTALNFDKIIMSTGMSTADEVRAAYDILSDGGKNEVTVMHCNSSYPAPVDELNLNCITTLKQSYPDAIIGYSGHEFGIIPTVAAVSMGATVIERHITLDREMWGTDQKSSVEPHGLFKLVKYVRELERALGTGIIGITDAEQEVKKKLRG